MVITFPFTSIKSKRAGIAVISLDLSFTFICPMERPISQRNPERIYGTLPLFTLSLALLIAFPSIAI